MSSVRRFLAEYRFRLEGLTYTEITIRLYEAGSKVEWDQNHYIKTPQQLGPYSPSRTFEDTLEAALHSAVMSIVSYYQSAVKAGLEPADEWLVPNTSFGA